MVKKIPKAPKKLPDDNAVRNKKNDVVVNPSKNKNTKKTNSSLIMFLEETDNDKHKKTK